MLLTLELDPHLEFERECVHDGHTHAVQATRHLVAVLVELATGMQHRHGHLDAGHAFLLVHVDRNAASVVLDRDGVVDVNRDGNATREPGERFIDGVVDDLVDEMVQTAR